MMETQTIGAKLGIAFALDFKDAEGNVLKTIQCRANLPLSELGLTEAQAQSLIDEQEPSNGNHCTE